MSRNVGFLLFGIVIFILGAVFVVIDGEPKWAEGVALFAGLAFLTAAHLPDRLHR